MKLFSRTLTVIVNGEIAQLLGSRCKADREAYQQRIYAKTASLFETSAQSAALIARTPESEMEALRHYGYEVGMAFQIIDDILDFTGDQATVGKPVGSDLRQGIVTLPVLEYIDAHPTSPFAQPLCEGTCLDDEQIDRLIEAIQKSDAIQRSHQEAAEHVRRSLESLRRLSASSERYALEELANYIVERKF